VENAHVDRRTKYTLQAIQTTLLELLEKKGLENISVTEICERADVNRGTFYKYYRDINDLYDQTEDKFVDGLREVLETGNTSDLFARVTTMLQSHEFFVRPRYMGEGSSRLLGKLLGLVRPGMTENVLVRRPDLSREEADFLSEYVIGGCARMYEVWIRGGMTTPAKKLQKYINSFVETSLQSK
jgi:AcrR family transcriptional regulator